MKNQEVNITKIAKYNEIIKKNPSKHQAYDLKGRALMEINRLEESLECYNEAIKLESNNKIYLAQRAKLYGLTDQADKAFEDLKLISQLQQHSNEDAFNNLILSNALQEVQKLDSVNKKITELRNDKNINPGLLDAIKDLSSVTVSLVVKVGIHEEKLMGHDDAIMELQAMQEQSMALIEKIQNANNEDLSKMQSEIESQRLNALFAEAKYKALESRVTDLEKFKEKFPEHFMKFTSKEKEFEIFLQNYDNQIQSALKDYMESFMSQCSVSYIAALVLKSGQFKLDISNIYVTLGAKLLSFIPFIGREVASGINFVYEKIQNIEISAKADNIVKYSPSVYSFEQYMKYVVINRLMNDKKYDIIINAAEEETRVWYQQIKKIYKDIKLVINDKIQENKALKQSTPQYKLGIKDANELLEKFLLSGKALELNNKGLDDMINILLPVKIEDTNSIALQIEDTNSIALQIEDTNSIALQIEDKKKGCCESIRNKCVIFSVKDMIYDNELLNHPEILRSLVKEFGISRVLDMSSNLSSELISEAIEQNDAELLLAGCISLNYYDVI
jgi:tetratricopeptide (TPR) repeat protein